MDVTNIQNSINKVIQQFAQNPFNYFYEEDIRVDLGNDLLSNFKVADFTHNNSIIKNPIILHSTEFLLNIFNVRYLYQIIVFLFVVHFVHFIFPTLE